MKLNVKSASAATVVAGAAFVASAGHIVSVVNETNPIYFALAYPIGIDGLLYVGIRALQTKRYASGTLALMIGAIYSLAFNAHAEGAFEMPPLMIASSMPVCMFAAFLIEAFGQFEEPDPIQPPAPQVVTQVVHPTLLPIAPFRPEPKAIPARAPRPRPIVSEKIETEMPKTEGRGRKITWDVEKAVKLILSDGQNDDEIASVVGTNSKSVYKVRRVIRLLSDGQNEEQAAGTANVSARFVSRIATAIKED